MRQILRDMAELVRKMGRVGCLWSALGVLAADQTLAQDVMPASVLPCDTCGPGGSGIGGWTLYWHNPADCKSPCRCAAGVLTCPTTSAPWIYGSAEFVPMFRDQLTSAVFQASEITTGTTVTRSAVLTSDDFDDDFDPGIKLSLGFVLSDSLRVEGAYWGSYSWSDTQEARYPADATGNLLSPFSSFGDSLRRPGLPPITTATYAPVVGQDFNELARISYTSELNTAEINLRHRLPNISTTRVAAETSVLVGVRQMKISETFNYFSESSQPVAGTQNSVSVLTDNDLIGPQIGALGQFLVNERSWIDFEVKGAMLLGTMDSQFEAQFPVSAGPPSGPFSRSEHATAFLGDLSLQYNYQFARSFTVKAGYNAFFVSGVALASDNLNSNVATLLTGPGTLDHSGRVVYHGPSLGLVWAR